MTTAEPADDGNVYLMRPGPTPLVYVISPTGSVFRRIEISAPAEGFRATAIKPAAARIAIEFVKDNPEGTGSIYVYSVFDAHTGERVADYSSTPEAGGAWACYTPDEFTFISSQGNPPRMTLVRAKP